MDHKVILRDFETLKSEMLAHSRAMDQIEAQISRIRAELELLKTASQ